MATPLREGCKSGPYPWLRSPEEQAARGSVGLTSVDLESWILKVQQKGVCDCISRNLKVGASDLGTTDSGYLDTPFSGDPAAILPPLPGTGVWGSTSPPSDVSVVPRRRLPGTNSRGEASDPGLSQSERHIPLRPRDWWGLVARPNCLQ